MNRRAPVLITFLFALTIAPTILTAQTRLFFGAGATLPNGDYGEYANTGWLANVGLGFGLGSNPRLGANVSFWYGSNSHSDIDGTRRTCTADSGTCGTPSMTGGRPGSSR